MKLLFSISVIVACITACGSLRKNEGFTVENAPTPPGTVEISDNLYFDYTEATNFNYLEFLYWTDRTYGGRQTPEYLSIVPDSTVWTDVGSGYQGLDDFYLRHPAYRDYPVVGVSYEQALAFCKWRSDRVMEYLLIKNEVFPFIPVSNPDSVFTIEKYFTGNYLNIQPDPRFYIYPEYSLPDSATYFKAILFADSLNAVNIKACKKRFDPGTLFSETNCFDLLQNKTLDQPYGTEPTVDVDSWMCKKDLITHLKGNVRELTNVKGVFYGNSFVDSCNLPANRLVKDTLYINCYTGFRNICTYKKWENKH